MSAVQPQPDPLAPMLRALKVFVIVAGIVLVFGTVAFVVLLSNKRATERETAAALRAGPPISIAVPEDAKLTDLRLDGDRALLVLEDAGGGRYLLWLDLESGERLSLLRLDG